MNKKALIIGIDSMIGTELGKALTEIGWDVTGTTRRKKNTSKHIFYLDLAALELNFDISVNAIIICAAITKITQCKNDVAYSQRVTQDAPVQLVSSILQKNPNAHIVFLSTSAVFDGQKPYYKTHEKSCPTTAYGQYKSVVENKLMALGADVSIVRLTKVLTPQYPLITEWMQALRSNQPIEPFFDLSLCPISIKNVIHALKDVLERKYFGFIHLSGERDITYQELAEALMLKIKRAPLLIKPKSALSVGISKEEAPPYTSLDMTESKKLFYFKNNSIEETLESLYFMRCGS